MVGLDAETGRFGLDISTSTLPTGFTFVQSKHGTRLMEANTSFKQVLPTSPLTTTTFQAMVKPPVLVYLPFNAEMPLVFRQTFIGNYISSE